jgi:serine/threonine protein kinase
MLCVMTTDDDAAAPQLLDGRYRLEGRLGSGGVAEVYRAVDERLERDVAVKVFRGDVAEELQRHEEEMRTLARLDHPSLVTVFDAGTDENGRPYLVMQLVEGTTLSDLLRDGPLPAGRTASIGAAVADALSYVHAQGLVHRDVKPANVLVAHDGRVALADFGIARLVDSAHVTRTGDVLGTPAYFAPEQIAGEAVGPLADVYALGLVLLECLTGRRAYDGTALESAMARLAAPPVIPQTLSATWRDLITAMTARQPTQRITAAQAAAVLQQLTAGDDSTVAMNLAPASTMLMDRPPAATTVMPPVAPAATTTTTTTAPPPRKRSGVRFLFVLLVLFIAAGIAVAVALNVGNGGGGSAHDCFTKSPTLHPKQLENDMRALERLACR